MRQLNFDLGTLSSANSYTLCKFKGHGEGVIPNFIEDCSCSVYFVHAQSKDALAAGRSMSSMITKGHHHSQFVSLEYSA
jgi:hypothetical protein